MKALETTTASPDYERNWTKYVYPIKPRTEMSSNQTEVYFEPLKLCH